MDAKFIGKISLATIIFLLVWILFGILFPGSDGQIETVEDLVNQRTADQLNQKFNFLFSFILNFLLVALYVSLYLYFKNRAPEWCAIGFVFIPAFAVFAVAVFSLSAFLVPYLLELYKNPEYQSLISGILKTMLHGEVNPAREFLSIPFIFLSIPTMIFGILLLKERIILKFAGILIIVSGIEYLSNLIAIFERNVILNTIGMIGGLSFMVSLILLSIGFLRGTPEKKTPPPVS
ncbi:DUF4386 family protein [candidate division KSB1 bacterium]